MKDLKRQKSSTPTRRMTMKKREIKLERHMIN